MEQRFQSTQSTTETVASEAARLVSRIVQALASQPAEILVSVTSTAEGAYVKVGLQRDDYFMVLGQQARVLKSLQTILNGMARRAGENISLEVWSVDTISF